MPIYEYRCGKCKNEFEIFHRTGNPMAPSCPECLSMDVTRLISPAGFVLKGSGWYVTDYPSDSRRKAIEKEKKGEDTRKKDKKENKDKPAPSKSDSGKKGESK